MKDILLEAGEVLSHAENKLRRMMEVALSKQRYTDVAKLAHLADALLNMTGSAVSESAGSTAVASLAAGMERDGGEKNGEERPTPSPQRLGSNLRLSDTGYPRFERQNDRLVKLAWSKKDRREYEHRAPADVVFRVAELFEGHCAIGTAFLMDALMPFRARTGEDIPSYQAYLALAWFRSFGAVESRGKDGYAVAVPHLRRQAEETWKQLPDVLRR